MRERGSAAMEFAVVVPLLIVVTMGLVDFGRAAYEAIGLANAAHAGASYGARNAEFASDKKGIQNAALADLDGDLKKSGGGAKVHTTQLCECSDGSSVSCEQTCAGMEPFMYLRVQVSKTFQTMIKYPGVTAKLPLSRTVEVRVR